MGVTKDTQSPGDGENFPKPGDELQMHYRGTLAENGSEFDSSHKYELEIESQNYRLY